LLAEQDVDQIIDYLLQESIKVAETFVEAAYNSFERLAEHPEIGHHREDLTNSAVKILAIELALFGGLQTN
jgi:plasmid stabilization system protein ParE